MRKSTINQFMQKSAGILCGGLVMMLAAPASAQQGLTPTAEPSYQDVQKIYEEAGKRLDQNNARFVSDGSAKATARPVEQIYRNAGDRMEQNYTRYSNGDPTPSVNASECGYGGCGGYYDDCCGGAPFGMDSLVPECCLGEPFTISDQLLGECSRYNIGGWTQWGWHSESNGLFNNHDSRIHNHQSWLFLERVADGSHGMDWGFRTDFMYGVDAQDTQAFGAPNDHWDNDWDNGIYGWALPQLYLELAYCDWTVKAGKFYTPTGYEVVPATGNFFYSHAYTMFNSEPFTHTGVLVTHQTTDSLQTYAGWTMGWDTGFEQFDDGSQFLGGFAYDISCNTTFTYITNVGDFGLRGEGYQHSIVLDHAISDSLNYVFQSDVLDTNVPNDHSVGINQYLIYTLSDCLAAGTRLEWYKFDGRSQYAWTWGVNYRPHANVVLRPELRHDWNPSGVRFNGDGKGNFTTVAMDAILTF